MVPMINVGGEQHVCLTPRILGVFDLMTSLAKMALAWRVKALEFTLGAIYIYALLEEKL
jgi:hypothetical protein